LPFSAATPSGPLAWEGARPAANAGAEPMTAATTIQGKLLMWMNPRLLLARDVKGIAGSPAAHRVERIGQTRKQAAQLFRNWREFLFDALRYNARLLAAGKVV
jgi:hypothetical protein